MGGLEQSNRPARGSGSLQAGRKQSLGGFLDPLPASDGWDTPLPYSSCATGASCAGATQELNLKRFAMRD
jgi:hypothetical protein